MNTWQMVGVGFGVLIIGFISTLGDHTRILRRREFAAEYIEKFQDFMRSCRQEADHELYYWLTHRGPKMQRELGVFGTANYRPAFENYIMHDYQLIINTLPEMLSGIAMPQQSGACEDALIRYIGWLDDLIASSVVRLRNPVIWLRNGFRWILALPVMILHWFGLIGEASATRFTTGRLFNVFASAVGFVSSLLGLLAYFVGTEDVTRFLRGLLKL